MKTVKIDTKIDTKEIDRLLDYWLDKVEDVYKKEVEKSMDNFRKEIGIKKA